MSPLNDAATMKRDVAGDVDLVEDATAGLAAQHGPDRIHGVAMPARIACLSVKERDDLERRLRRKIDFRLLPMVILMYILNYIDRCGLFSSSGAHCADGATVGTTLRRRGWLGLKTT